MSLLHFLGKQSHVSPGEVFNHPCIYKTRYQREEVKEIKCRESALT